MTKPLRRRVLEELNRLEIPVVLIGAQAVKSLGSSRESYDVDFAARNLDIDRIIDLMYRLGFRLPVAAPDIGKVRWAKDATAAKSFVLREKSGALNFYILDEDGNIIDQVDFVIDNPVPFAMLYRDAFMLSVNPSLKSASVDHLIRMKEKRIAEGKGKMTDEADLSFLKDLKSKKSRRKK